MDCHPRRKNFSVPNNVVQPVDCYEPLAFSKSLVGDGTVLILAHQVSDPWVIGFLHFAAVLPNHFLPGLAEL